MEQVLQIIPLKTIFSCLVVGAVAVLLLTVSRRFAKFLISKELKRSLVRPCLTVFRVIILLITILTILQICGVNVTSLLAGLGIVGAIIGFAVQDFIRDFVMGIHITSDRFFQVGDGVEWDGREGLVTEFSMQTTKIEYLDDHSVVSICNRDIEKMHKFGKTLFLTIPLPYSVSAERGKAVMSEIASRIAGLPQVTACRYAGLDEFGESALKFSLEIDCEVADRLTVRRAAQAEILQTLAENGIAVPFNQLDVHLDK